MKIDREVAAKVLEVVDAGLVYGMGEPIPGQMCVEAAVCYALGLEHSDDPKCVGRQVRAFKIRLNDSTWRTSAYRTAGMRKLAIAQLGSDTIDQERFREIVVRETIRQIMPIALRATAELRAEHAGNLKYAAELCERTPIYENVDFAQRAATKAGYVVPIYSYFAIKSAYTAYYAAEFANDASYIVFCAPYKARPDVPINDIAVLQLSAKIAIDALIELDSPGCAYLDLCS